MPEGDSVHKVAAHLRPRLEGYALRDVRTRGDTPLPALIGQRVRAVRTHGKHLVLEPERGPALRVHLGMRGRWRRYDPGVRWRRSRQTASLILTTDEHVFACFRAHVEVLRGALPERAPSLAGLGADLLDPGLDLERVLARAYANPARPLGELLLDQRVAAGIGNVYKSEVLFLSGLAPQTPAGRVAPEALREVYARAARLLRANLGPGWRVTRGFEAGEQAWRPGRARHYVYRRAGQPCFRCQTPVAFARQGERNRATWWCASCQPAI